jgi:hypothetical protein
MADHAERPILRVLERQTAIRTHARNHNLSRLYLWQMAWITAPVTPIRQGRPHQISEPLIGEVASIVLMPVQTDVI